eukprot:4488657-Prymnesium_polylepis.1
MGAFASQVRLRPTGHPPPQSACARRALVFCARHWRRRDSVAPLERLPLTPCRERRGGKASRERCRPRRARRQ